MKLDRREGIVVRGEDVGRFFLGLLLDGFGLDGLPRVVDLDVGFEVSVGTAEGAGEAWVVLEEQGANAFEVLQGAMSWDEVGEGRKEPYCDVRAGSDEERLTHCYWVQTCECDR